MGVQSNVHSLMIDFVFDKMKKGGGGISYKMSGSYSKNGMVFF